MCMKHQARIRIIYLLMYQEYECIYLIFYDAILFHLVLLSVIVLRCINMCCNFSVDFSKEKKKSISWITGQITGQFTCKIDACLAENYAVNVGGVESYTRTPTS